MRRIAHHARPWGKAADLREDDVAEVVGLLLVLRLCALFAHIWMRKTRLWRGRSRRGWDGCGKTQRRRELVVDGKGSTPWPAIPEARHPAKGPSGGPCTVLSRLHLRSNSSSSTLCTASCYTCLQYKDSRRQQHTPQPAHLPRRRHPTPRSVPGAPTIEVISANASSRASTGPESTRDRCPALGR